MIESIGDKEFVAYSRKLLRENTKIEEALMNDDKLLVLTLIRELKEDTEKDIEAWRE